MGDNCQDIPENPNSRNNQDTWELAGKRYNSRLLVGTGKYASHQQTLDAVVASGAEIVTVAIRRLNHDTHDTHDTHGQSRKTESLLDYIDPQRWTILPNTAGCFTAKDAVHTAKLAAELFDGKKLIKLEVLAEGQQLYPNIRETLVACEQLIKDNFQIMVYTNDDPVMALEFEKMGCVAVMPLGSPIGSGLGIFSDYNIKAIISAATVPILVDAGIGAASDSAEVLELGCSGVLMNTAIAKAKNPVLMAEAMKLAVMAGRKSYLAGRIPKRNYGSASSPKSGIISQL